MNNATDNPKKEVYISPSSSTIEFEVATIVMQDSEGITIGDLTHDPDEL